MQTLMLRDRVSEQASLHFVGLKRVEKMDQLTYTALLVIESILHSHERAKCPESTHKKMKQSQVNVKSQQSPKSTKR